MLQGMIFDDFLDLWLPFGSLWFPFGSLLIPFWLPLAPFWLPLAPFWLPLAPFWLPLGDNNSGGIWTATRWVKIGPQMHSKKSYKFFWKMMLLWKTAPSQNEKRITHSAHHFLSPKLFKQNHFWFLKPNSTTKKHQRLNHDETKCEDLPEAATSWADLRRPSGGICHKLLRVFRKLLRDSSRLLRR